MYCKNCGNEIHDGAAFCYHCGCAVDNGQYQPYQPQTQTQTTNEPQKNNTLAIIGFVLAFFMPLAGLICSIIGLKNAPQYNGNGKGFAIAGIILSAIIILIILILIILFVVIICSFGQFFEGLEGIASIMIL